MNGTVTVLLAQALKGTSIRAESMDYNNPVHTLMRVTIYAWLTMWVFVAIGGCSA